MNVRKALIPALLAYIFFSFACVYIVLPEGLETPEAVVEGAELKIWNAVVTNVGKSDAGIYISILRFRTILVSGVRCTLWRINQLCSHPPMERPQIATLFLLALAVIVWLRAFKCEVTLPGKKVSWKPNFFM